MRAAGVSLFRWEFCGVLHGLLDLLIICLCEWTFRGTCLVVLDLYSRCLKGVQMGSLWIDCIRHKDSILGGRWSAYTEFATMKDVYRFA